VSDSKVQSRRRDRVPSCENEIALNQDAEREGELIALDEAVATGAKLMGLPRTELSGLAAQCTRDLATRRAIETAVNALLHRLADEGGRRAAKFGEPKYQSARSSCLTPRTEPLQAPAVWD